MGRIMIGAGLVLVLAGMLVMLLERLPSGWGRLPGDIVMRSKGTTFYFPIATCILLSLLASLIMWLLNKR